MNGKLLFVVNFDILAPKNDHTKKLNHLRLNDLLKKRKKVLIGACHSLQNKVCYGLICVSSMSICTVTIKTPMFKVEGLDFDDPWIWPHTDLIQKIFDTLQEQHLTMIKGPPISGKTAFMELMSKFLKSQGKTVYSIRLLHNWVDIMPKFLHELKSSQEAYFLVDEAQVGYKHPAAEQLWVSCKDIMGRQTNCRVLLAAAYNISSSSGNGTPFVPQTFFSLPELRLQKPQYDVFMKLYNDQGYALPILKDSTLYNSLFACSEGQIGFIKEIVRTFYTHFESDLTKGTPVGENDMLSYLVGSSFLSALRTSSRVFKFYDIMDETAKNLARKLLLSGDTEFNSSGLADFDSLVQLGILVSDADGQCRLRSPLVRTFLLLVLCPRSEVDTVNFDKNIDNFLVSVLENMNTSILRNTLSRGIDDKILERQWQMEFYRCVLFVLPPSFSVSPDVGATFGSAGFLDFYINGKLNWAIELLREGNKIGEHLERFDQGGMYHSKIPYQEHRILDFRSVDKKALKKDHALWTIYYSEDYTRILISCSNPSYDGKSINLK